MSLQPTSPNLGRRFPEFRILATHPKRDPNRLCQGCQTEPAAVTVEFGGSCRVELCEECKPEPPRIVGWHVERLPKRLCEGCQIKPSIYLVDYGDDNPSEACEDCKPADAYDAVGEIFAKVVRAVQAQ